MGFCCNTGFRRQIIELLYNELFDMPVNSGASFKNFQVLEEWYKMMISLQNADNQVWLSSATLRHTSMEVGRKKDILLNCDKHLFAVNNVMTHLAKKGYTHIGHDVPVWLTPDLIGEDIFSTKRIMIISQDPRRDLPGNGVLLSSPFGLHCQAYCKGQLETNIATRLLNKQKDGKGISLYFTDFYKLYAKDLANPKSISTKLLNGYNVQFKSILDKEIELFQPDLIVTFGGFSSDKLMGKGHGYWGVVDCKGHKALPVYHTSGLAAGARKKARAKWGYEKDEDMYTEMIYNAL